MNLKIAQVARVFNESTVYEGYTLQTLSCLRIVDLISEVTRFTKTRQIALEFTSVIASKNGEKLPYLFNTQFRILAPSTICSITYRENIPRNSPIYTLNKI